MAEPVLKLENITHRYGDGELAVEVLSGLSLILNPGELVALTGPSGSGKSTLLQIGGLLDQPTNGAVIVQGKPAEKLNDKARTILRRDTLGFIYQFHHLLPEFTALENVRMPLRIAGKLDKENQAETLLKQIGLEDRMTHRPGELSGGERQRVAIARALIHRPSLILADEPTGNLDESKAQGVFDLLLKLVRETGAAALIATHNLDLARQMDQAYRLHHGRLETL